MRKFKWNLDLKYVEDFIVKEKNEIHRGEATGHEGKSTMFQQRTDIIMWLEIFYHQVNIAGQEKTKVQLEYEKQVRHVLI